MMSIYLHELKTYRKNTLLWIGGIVAGLTLFLSMFPAFAKSAQALATVLKFYPAVLLEAFGLSMVHIDSVTGFFSFVSTFLNLIGAIQAMHLGLSILSREITGRTADFLFTRPAARGKILAMKLLAAFTLVSITSAAFVLAATGLAFSVSDKAFDFTPFLLMALSFYFEQLLFLALGFAIASAAKRIRSVLPLSLGIVFGLFILGAVASTLNQPDLYYLSPFKYFETMGILQRSAYDPAFSLTAAGVTLLCVALGFAVYTRRDIPA